ncbi:MAG: hypothetical protein HGA37_07320 [Lentimicrobium sp.]|nr:hypothetical protein [Lentimicrobium sp.]
MRPAIKIIIRLDKRNTGFRFYALRRGKAERIPGSISYYGDNHDIAIHAEGKERILQHYISILRKGTPFSKVISVVSIPTRMLNSKYFEILPNIIPLTGSKVKKPFTIGFKMRSFRF